MRYVFLVLALLGGISVAYAGPKGQGAVHGENNGATHTNCGANSGNQGSGC